MRRFVQFVGSLFLLAPFAAACASDKLRPSPTSLPGHYYLQGVTEVGSQLLLHASGKYKWMLSYGAEDMSSSGTWQLKENELVLTDNTRAAPVFRLMADDELRLRKAASEGSWVAIVGIPHVGPIADVDVRFETESGKTADAKSLPNGDAIVKMPASERWTRAGLRARANKGEWQWFDVPAPRAAARIVGFTVTNPEAFLPIAFSTLTLKREREGLVTDEGMLSRGVYVKR